MKPTFLLAACMVCLSALPWNQALAVPVSVDIPWEKSWPVVTPQGAASFGFELKNEGGESAEVVFSALLTSPSGDEEKIRQTLALQPGEKKQIPWPLTGREMGSWGLRYTVTQKADAGREIAGKMNFAYMEAAGPNTQRPEFKFGIVSHSQRLPQREREREMEASAFVGAKVLRDGPEWGTLQATQDPFNWDILDEMVTTCESLGMELQVLLAFTPQWAAAAEKQKAKDWLVWSRSAPDSEAWRAYVAACAARYKGRIHLWEIWNEPDLQGFWQGTTDEYINMVRIAAEELRKADPDNRVMSGGFATLTDHGGRALNPDLQERTMKTVGTLLDFHAVHEHGPFAQFARLVDGPYAQLRASLPEPVPRLFFNETAMHSMGGAEKEQARILVKKASFARSRKAAGYLWYDLTNDGTDPEDPEHNFGLLTNRMEPKPAYAAFGAFARLVVPRPYLKQIEAGDNRWFFLHGDEKEKLLVYWNDDEGTQNEQILLRLPGVRQASLIDINGNARALDAAGDFVVVPSGKEPRYVLAVGARTVEPAGKLAGPSRAFFGAPGEEVEVDCEFENPTGKPVEVGVEWQAPQAIKMLSAGQDKIRMDAGGRGKSVLKVRLPEGRDYRFGSGGRLRVHYEFSGAPYQGTIVVPVHYGTLAIPADTPGRGPDIQLDSREQLFSFIEADPHMLPYRWKGPEDLSARVWISADAADFILRVDVTDNRHFQNEPSSSMWKGDSVQCVLALPGQKGTWEFGFAEHEDGKAMAVISEHPSEMSDSFLGKIKAQVEKRGEGRVYTVRLPRKEVGLTGKILREGFRFNIAVNDNDGQVRAHALQLARGIVEGKSIETVPYVVLKNPPLENP